MGVFDAAYAEQYDELYSGKSYVGECDLVESAISRYATTPTRSILDVGCGTGGHAILLAQRRYDVLGVDRSTAMLDCARGKAAQAEGNRPEWLSGDIRTFHVARQFDAAIMMFAVVGYLTENDDVCGGLVNIRRHLKPGALFMCDFWYGPSVLTVRPTDRVRTIETADRQIIRATSTTLDATSHTADVKFRLWSIAGDRVVSESTESHRLRYFFPQEFRFLLSQCGFALKSLSAFPSLDAPLTDLTWNAFVVACAV